MDSCAKRKQRYPRRLASCTSPGQTGECEWEDTMVGESVRKRLEECISKTRYAADALARHYVFFARQGFSEELQKAAHSTAASSS